MKTKEEEKSLVLFALFWLAVMLVCIISAQGPSAIACAIVYACCLYDHHHGK